MDLYELLNIKSTLTIMVGDFEHLFIVEKHRDFKKMVEESGKPYK